MPSDSAQTVGVMPRGAPNNLDGDAVDATGSSWSPDEVAEILYRAGIFRRVETRTLSALTEQLQPVDFPAGHTVYADGESSDRLYILISGKVKIGRSSPDGREDLLTIMGPADMFGEFSTFDKGPRTTSATAITDVRAVPIDGDTLRAWISAHPELAEQLLRVLARRQRRTNHLADLIYTDVPGRVAIRLLQLARRFGTQEDGALRVTHDLTEEEIAQWVGASPESVNNALADFASRGWIQLAATSVLIADSELLARRARASSDSLSPAGSAWE